MLNSKLAVLTVALFASAPLMAQDGMTSGMSDETKLWLLAGMLVFQIVISFSISGIMRTLLGNKDLWKNITKSAPVIALMVMLGSATELFAQAAPASQEYVMDAGLESLLIWLNAIMLVFNIYLISSTRSMVKDVAKLKSGKALLHQEESEDGFARFMKRWTKAVPLEREGEVLMEDHDYDGIHELDNSLPPWWVAGFYITIFFSVVYIGYYHFYEDGNIMQNELQAEMEVAAAEKEAYLAMVGGMIDETNVELLADASSIAAGKEIFEGKGTCVACHGADLGGSVGPNLTDDYWLHGCDVKDVFTTIKYGVPEKGMIAWESQLTPVEMQQLSSYIISMKGTNSGGKEAQGDLCAESVEEPVQTEESDEMAQEEVIAEDMMDAEAEEQVTSESSEQE